MYKDELKVFGDNLCVGFGKIKSSEQYIEAASSAIEDYLANENIFFCNTIIIIIKITENFQLSKTNEITELVQKRLNRDTLIYSGSVEDESINGKIEITLVGI